MTSDTHRDFSKEYVIRRAVESDLPSVAELVVRLKRLNEEFDPLLKVREDAKEVAVRDYGECIKKNTCLVYVCEHKGRVVAVVKAVIRERVYYDPKVEGAIIDFYVMPEHRRTGLGNRMVQEVTKELRARGAGLIVADFPLQNKIASNFYAKLGYRPIMGTYGIEQ